MHHPPLHIKISTKNKPKNEAADAPESPKYEYYKANFLDLYSDFLILIFQ